MQETPRIIGIEETEALDETTEEADDESGAHAQKTRVEWIEAIPPGRFYLRVGLGRKATGSYYTPHSFVRFLVQETLGPQVAERSPQEDPGPGEILQLKVLVCQAKLGALTLPLSCGPQEKTPGITQKACAVGRQLQWVDTY